MAYAGANQGGLSEKKDGADLGKTLQFITINKGPVLKAWEETGQCLDVIRGKC